MPEIQNNRELELKIRSIIESDKIGPDNKAKVVLELISSHLKSPGPDITLEKK